LSTSARRFAPRPQIARTTLSPRLKVEQWLAKKSVEGKVKVKEFEGKNVDEAYGYLFSCMSKEITAINSSDPGDPTSLVFAMPRFLRSSATSFTRFATDVGKIVESVATPLNIDVDYYHPEGVDEEKVRARNRAGAKRQLVLYLTYFPLACASLRSSLCSSLCSGYRRGHPSESSYSPSQSKAIT